MNYLHSDRSPHQLAVRATVHCLAFAADTLSITPMEIVDNAIMLVIPGAMKRR